MAPLRVCLDACSVSGTSGGAEQVIIGLASGLSKLADGDEEYLFLTYADADDWIRPHVYGPCRILPGPRAPRSQVWKGAVDATLLSVMPWAMPLAREAWYRLSGLKNLSRKEKCPVPKSDGTIEKAGIDIMHFTTPGGFLTAVPSIYQPFDLQHVHLPHLFSEAARATRERQYPIFCRQARMIPAMTTWVKNDLIRHFNLPEEKVRVVPLAPVLAEYPVPTEDDLAAARQKFALPESFAFYPAQTWAHKNHIGLLEALVVLRDRYRLTVPFVFSGRLNAHFPHIRRRVEELGLASQVRFLGFVSPLELQSLYKLCRCIIFPSKFEGWGMPLTEAFFAGVPAACSNVTSLPEQAGDAALIFDPERPEEIAAAIHRLWTDAELRRTLAARGRARVARFTWERTARLLRAHYRRLAGRALTEEDRELLRAPDLV
jgi:glycosyltransferase involved in cell wall biosynthesis